MKLYHKMPYKVRYTCVYELSGTLEREITRVKKTLLPGSFQIRDGRKVLFTWWRGKGE